MDLSNLDQERVYEAISKGVEDAMWRMITNATDAPCNDFFESIKEGVSAAIPSH